MAKLRLPIHRMSEQKFHSSFKGKYLDREVLTEKDLKSIEKIFGLDDRNANSKVGCISCDEAHLHNYECNFYHSPEAGVVDRLLNEIDRYKSKLEKLRKYLKEE